MVFQVFQGSRLIDATDIVLEFGQFQIAESAMSTDSVEIPAIDADRFIATVSAAGYTIAHIG